MKSYLFLLILLVSALSCKKIYTPEINAKGKVLVVEGGVTDDNPPYHVRLGYAVPYDSSGTAPVAGAKVVIGDDLGHEYLLHESQKGNYFTNVSDFTGTPGRSYQLRITTKEGDIYESTPQELLAGNIPDSVYGAYGTQQVLVEDVYKQSFLKTISGANIYVDVNHPSDTLQHYRFESSVTTEYMIVKEVSPMVSVYFYGWESNYSSGDVNITNEPYPTSGGNIVKHEVTFMNTDNEIYTNDIDATNVAPGVYGGEISDSLVFVPVYLRLLFLKQYRITGEAFEYYKGIEQQLKAEGKIFDPAAVQLNGNVHCVNDPEKVVLGFFEASSVIYSAFKINTLYKSKPPEISEIPYHLPAKSNGFTVSVPPDFWVE